MKKSNILTCIMAVIAIVAIIFGVVTNGKKADLQKQITDLTANVATLTSSLDAAKQEAADAVKAGEDAVAAAKEEAAKAQEEALAALQAEADKKLEEAVAAAKEEAAKLTEAAAEKVEETVETVKETVEEAVPAETAAVMTYAEYAAAELDSEVTIEAYVQAKQSWWQDQATIYLQDADGAYFVYNLAISEDDYNALVPGTKIRVTGYKTEWSSEVEIDGKDATFEVIEADPFIAEAADVTDLLGKDALIDHQNQLVAVKGVTVEAYDDTGAAFAYKDPVGKTDDLYFKVSKDGETYEFCVEFYLCGKDTEVYQAVEAMNVGDVIDLEGFLYWYNGANLQATKLVKAE